MLSLLKRKYSESVEEDAARLEALAATENDEQYDSISRMYPAGFFTVQDNKGVVLEFRHWCPKCHLLTTGNPTEVRHCGRVDVRKTTFLATLFMPSTTKV